MAGRRTYGSYDDGCAAAHALDIIGERWSMSIVRELILGPKRFVELQRDVAGIGPTILARRLEGLAAKGVLRRNPGGRETGGHVYELTEWGYQLEHVNAALGAWGARSAALPWKAAMTPDTIVLAMRAHLAHASGVQTPRSVLLDIRDTRTPGTSTATYIASLTAQGASIARTDTPTPGGCDAALTCSTEALKNVIIVGADWGRTDDFHVTGDRAAVDDLIEAARFR